MSMSDDKDIQDPGETPTAAAGETPTAGDTGVDGIDDWELDEDQPPEPGEDTDEDGDDDAGPPEKTPEEHIAELKDQLLRALAETQNVRRRADRERADTSKYAIANFARDVVVVADNLRRTIESAADGTRADAASGGGDGSAADDAKLSAADAAKLSAADAGADHAAARALLAGVEMTERDLLASLERHGIRPVTPMGEKFDHNFHQAMFELETADQEPGTVVQVMQTGYVIGDRLLRPAMVGIAKAPGGGGNGAQGPDTDTDTEGGPGPDAGSSLDTEA